MTTPRRRAAAVIVAIAACAMTAMLAGCGQDGGAPGGATTQSSQKAETGKPVQNRKLPTLDELKTQVDQETKQGIDSLDQEFQALKQKVSTYDQFVAATGDVQAFYAKVTSTTDELGVTMRERALDYANVVLSSGKPWADKYDNIDEMYDRIYDDAGSEIFDGIYDGVLKTAFNELYDGVVKSGLDMAGDYQQWSDVSSEEYERWSEASSDVYQSISDFRSDVYKFYSDIKGRILAKDKERVQEKIDDFTEKVDKVRQDVQSQQ